MLLLKPVAPQVDTAGGESFAAGGGAYRSRGLQAEDAVCAGGVGAGQGHRTTVVYVDIGAVSTGIGGESCGICLDWGCGCADAGGSRGHGQSRRVEQAARGGDSAHAELV